MARYQALLFDLFNTVALWDAARMPRFTWQGETSPSTLGVLEPVVNEHFPTLEFATFKDALDTVNAALAEERTRTLREIPSRVRFERTLTQAGVADAGAATRAAEALSLAHMAVLSDVAHIPPDHRAFLERCAADYRLALVSNFDHAPTARALVERDSAAGVFSAVFISDEHGWRKPHRSLFDDALGALGVRPEAALFIGDSVEDDLLGATAAGLDVAWVNARRAELPDDAPEPRYEVGAIPELEALLAAS